MKTATPTLDDTQACLESARSELSELERRVSAGDSAITAVELARARDAVTFAELQVAGAQDRATAEAEQQSAAERQVQVDQLQADLNAHTAWVTRTQESYRDLVVRLSALPGEVAALQAAAQDLTRRHRELGVDGTTPAVEVMQLDYVVEAVAEARGQQRRHPVTNAPMFHSLHSSAMRADVIEAAETAHRQQLEHFKLRDAQRQAERDARDARRDAEWDALNAQPEAIDQNV